MDIDRAKRLKVGDRVGCPADRGSPEFVGTVSHVGIEVFKTARGDEYIWVCMQAGGVWPSNRLG